MTSPQAQLSMGLLQCFHDFRGAYCVRKFTEFILSSVILLLSLAVMGVYAYKHRLERRLWLLAILSFLSLSLLANILFCFFNQQYWLYAVENYAYNLYFLFMVGYVCRAYLLKTKSAKLSAAKENSGENKNKEKTLFYAIFIALLVLYTGIFTASLMRELNSDGDSSGKVRYCEELEYLCFDVLCTIMSIVVLIILYRNQREESEKIEVYSSIARNRPRGSLLSDQNQKMGSSQEELTRGKVHNPLGSLWIWVLTNVAGQIFGLVQSGLLLDAVPSQCLIIKANPSASNYLDLSFTVLTMYLGFGATLWYITLVKLIRNRAAIDRTVIFSQEVKVEGNIELFNPSKQETIFML